MVIRWADPVSVFSDTYRNILYQSDISGQDAQSASIPRMFFPIGWKRQPEEGGIGPGCCGGGVITTWAAGDGVIAEGPSCLSRRQVLGPSAMVLAGSRNLSSIPRRSPARRTVTSPASVRQYTPSKTHIYPPFCLGCFILIVFDCFIAFSF